MRQIIFPYLTATNECWQLGPWRRLDAGADAELPDRLDDWDYSVPLSLASNVVVNVSRVRKIAHLSSEDSLVLAAIWEASSTGIREAASRHELPADGERSFELLLNLDGAMLGGHLTLERQIVLSSVGSGDDRLAARLGGSIILRESRGSRTTVILEGDAARFPTEVIDFGQLQIAEPDALWWLELDLTDLEQAPLSSMRLYVNGGHPAVRRALAGNDGIGELVRSVLRWDVARALILRALGHDDFCNDWDTYQEGTVGLTLQELIQRYWPGEHAESLRARRQSNPARFEYQLQARLALLGDIE